MKTIYGVTHGEYSSYCVSFLCATKAIAEAYVARNREYEIEEFVLVDNLTEQLEMALYNVQVDREGTEVRRWSTVLYVWQVDAEDHAGGSNGAWGWSVRGYDAALKAARDYLGIHKAKEAGI